MSEPIQNPIDSAPQADTLQESTTVNGAADNSPGMLMLFLINLGLAVIWSSFVHVFPPIDFTLGFLIGMGVLGIIYRDYLRRSLRLFIFVPYVLWQILKSNLSLAWTIIQPKKELERRLHPAIVAVPLTVSTDLEIMLLATIITLTPGTLSIDLGANAASERVLYVHSLLTEDPAEFCRSIKKEFEQPILRITRPGVL